MTTCAVSFDTGTLTGAVLPNAKLVFQSTDAPIRAVGVRIAPSDRYEVTADASGQGTISLAWGNWTVTMIAASGPVTVAFSVPAIASGRLEAMLGAPLTSVYSLIQLAVLAAGGRGLYETPAAGRAATLNGDIFLAPLGPTGVGIYRRDSAASSPQIGSYFTGEVQATPQDSTAGRLLSVGAFGLGASVIEFSGNIDDPSIATGFYRVVAAATGAKPFGNTAFNLIVSRRGASPFGNSSQLAVGTTNGETYTRDWTGTAWSAWARNYSNRSIVGSVTQTAGVPDGALMQPISNANGRAIRFADGTQICEFQTTAAFSIGIGFMGGFRSGLQSWTFPAAFIAPPSVTITPENLTAFGATLSGMPTTTSASWAALAIAAQADVSARSFDMIAVGRWF